MNDSKPLVIVLSRNYSTGLGIIRSLGAAGYTVDLVASTKKKGSSVIASSSKYVRNSVEVLSPRIQEDSGHGLIKVLMKYAETCKRTMVLFPADDFTASVIDSNRSILREHFLMPHIAGEADTSLSDFMNKAVQSRMARKAGLDTPEEWIVSLEDKISVPEDVRYPCFVKPLQSVSGHKTEMKVCSDKVELKKHLLVMKDFYSSRSVLVQEYLRIDKEYDLSGVCLGQEVIIPAVLEKTRIARHELGVTMSGRMEAVDILGEAEKKIKEMLRQFCYVGMFDMELHLCGGKFYFNEVNFRSGGPNYAYYLSGVNLPALFVRALTGEGRISEENGIKSLGKTFVYEKVAWEDYIYSHMTKKELRQCIEEADFTLLADEDDPGPGRRFYKRIRLSALKHRIKALGSRQNAEDDRADTDKKFEKTEPCVLLAGRNFCNILTMTRALGEAGYGVEILRIFKTRPSPFNILSRMKPDAYSKYVRKFCRCTADHDPAKVVNRLIEMADPVRKQLLMPVDDYSAYVVDENFDVLSKYYIIPNINKEAGGISSLMDKDAQKRLAAEFGLPMLNSSLIRSVNGWFEIPKSVRYPCFVKPNVSMKSTKAKMRKCRDEEELARMLAECAGTGDFEMLAEDFADIKAEYSILGLSTEEVTVAPGLLRVIEGGHRERKGVAITGESVPCSKLQPIITECVRFIESLHYTGLFDVDLIETKEGKVYFVELNFRAGASMHVFTETGVNLPGLLADYLMKGIPVDKNCCVRQTGKRFVSEKVLMEEYVRSDAGIRKVIHSMREADVYFIKDEKDPRPYRHFRRFYPAAVLMRLPYRIRDGRNK